MTFAEKQAIQTGAKASGLTYSAFVLGGYFRKEGVPAQRSYRRAEVVNALTAASKALDDIAAAIRGPGLATDFDLVMALLCVERALLLAAFPNRQLDLIDDLMPLDPEAMAQGELA
ncbi:hypothetical protein ACEN2J_19535 [Pseudorhodobacter sp. W20_MBD10_FR17]|uniref:hypothetical protein n=1 Tax=Pseudorhodobacter sp. W20_MBD10_FR17 TaxID=3240266 RepID=UPI003F976746